MSKPEKAVGLLEKAVELSPENLLAHKMLAQTWLQLKKPEKTLQAYKRVLFLDPENEKAKQIVQKMEPMTAKDYPDAGFAFKNLQDTAQYVTASNVEAENTPMIHPIPKGSKPVFIKEFEAHSAIAEALIYRGEFDRADLFLMEMKNVYAHQEELNRQIQFMEKKRIRMKQSVKGEMPPASPVESENLAASSQYNTVTNDSISQSKNLKKIQRLRQLMKRLENIPIEANNKL